ncbi:uncharacterized protein LOC34619404 [Cyclospora cayetanensis]|uniref:Uncharacterized protein LOC34619404 n=1 Tax=Cyclospora cayetanensis TaxID=88456 RepID=A0A6P6RY92_9EIME|nr:uncharacterized protein LOC34619404 [Cyclospora cayetanensis]
MNNPSEPNSFTIRCLMQLLAMGREEDALQLLEDLFGTVPSDSYSKSARDCFEAVGWRALDAMIMGVALRAFASAKRYDIVAWISTFEGMDEVVTLRAHVRAFHQNWREAVQLLLVSSDPKEALDLAAHAGVWNIAAELAKRFSTMTVPQLLQRHAMKCERDGQYTAALAAFTAAVDGIALQIKAEESRCQCSMEREDTSPRAVMQADSSMFVKASQQGGSSEPLKLAEQIHHQMFECLYGKVRCALKAGELQKGLQLAKDLNNPLVYRECAEVLLSIQQHRHAAVLFSRAGDFERAALIYIEVQTLAHTREAPKFRGYPVHNTSAQSLNPDPVKHKMTDSKNFCRCSSRPDNEKHYFDLTLILDAFVGVSLKLGEFGQLIPLLQTIAPSTYLLESYARAREQRQPLEALRAFGRAGNFPSVVRILALRLGRWEEAKALVRQVRDAQAAELLADACRANSDFQGAVEMLCIGEKAEAAITLAVESQQLSVLADALQDTGSAELHSRVSFLLESQLMFGLAARHKALAGCPTEALELYIQARSLAHVFSHPPAYIFQ